MDFNGRVNIMENGSKNQFTLHDRIPVKSTTSFRDAMQGNFIDTNLSRAFFSKENIEIIQNGIRAGVYKKSNGIYNVAPQSDDALKVIMRSTFLMYSANMQNDITQQIIALNDLVLDYCINSVYGEAQGYLKYLYDASTLVVPIERPMLSSEYNSIEFKRWF